MTTTPVAPAFLERIGVSRFIPSSKFSSVIVTFVLLVVMFGVGASRYRNFASGQVILNLFVDNAFLIVLAVGMTFVILTGGIDLSVGSVVALSTMIAASLARDGWPPMVIIAIVLVAGSTIGLLSGLVIHYFQIQPFIVTLAAMFLARGLCYVISLNSISITDPFFTAMANTRIPIADRMSITPSVIIALVVVAIGFLVLHYTRTGRTVYAIGGGEHSAMLMGLPVSRTKVLVYVISGFCSAVAGVLFTFYTLSGYSLTAVGMELDAIAAVVIGGTLLTGGYGFVLGSLLGVLLLGIIQTIISFEGTLSSWWTKIVIGGLLLVFIVLQRVLTARRK
ncbi:sugar ABC transporter permease YjfF [Glaciihabitans arcticus]|uniref:Sugar ABC transporter permease YjfF n=1 Tax=Glaciihabitans arcticus TaxID=2668039 RepID=A0A4Q9GMD0_9MICO|nr:galactofuranose ABC transporter, permease protein YjfF [Glaciihabitans arcticus]TBN55462.1 sugar ABC transporter permease YjfF [Glaciihabitans arcticus]